VERKAEIEQRAGHRLAVHQQVLLVQVPAARAHQQGGDLVVELVLLALGADESDRAAHRVAHVELAFDLVAPGRRVGVLEVGHVHAGAGVERVDTILRSVGRRRDPGRGTYT
jgi:hypothetical protein